MIPRREKLISGCSVRYSAGFVGSLRGKMVRDAKSLKREALKLLARNIRMMRTQQMKKAIPVAMAPQKIVEAAVLAASEVDARNAGGTPDRYTELLRCEGGDDFFEARLATQRVPQ